MTDQSMTESRGGRRAFVALSLGLVVIGGLLGARLLLVTVATPSDIWLSEFTPMVAAADTAVASPIANLVAPIVRDPAVVRTRLMECTARDVPRELANPCLAVVEEGLAILPTSAELWLERARVLATDGLFDDRFFESLRKSHDASPREGWIAAQRLPFLLRHASRLPPDLTELMAADLMMVLGDWDLAAPVARAYVTDPFLRDSTWAFVEQHASLEQQEWLIGRIRYEI
ncbi:MAG: hypothetical protein IT534_09175 [Bauldia sp.]|nr:hypothetical protein [Bauldia sp.]